LQFEASLNKKLAVIKSGEVVNAYNLSYMEGIGRKIKVQGCLGQKA
jgi:hypothetical protein